MSVVDDKFQKMTPLSGYHIILYESTCIVDVKDDINVLELSGEELLKGAPVNTSPLGLTLLDAMGDRMKEILNKYNINLK